MKGVVLAGGRGTRLGALTRGANKHLLPIAGCAMIEYPIETLIEAGLSEILIVTGADDEDAMRRFLSATPLSDRAELSLALQRQPDGIASALACARRFAQDEPVCVILGDNLLQHAPVRAIESFRGNPEGALVLLTRSDEPERFAIATFEDDDPARAIVSITEKPTGPAGDAVVIGLYLYDHRVFDVIDTLTPSGRGELEITDLNRAYLSKGQLRHAMIEGWWIDAGTPESLSRARTLLTQQEP